MPVVDVAQLVELQVVALVAAGSSPVAHPNFQTRSAEWGVRRMDDEFSPSAFRARHSVFKVIAPVAQLDRASDFESAGRPFESDRARHRRYGKVKRSCILPEIRSPKSAIRY